MHRLGTPTIRTRGFKFAWNNLIGVLGRSLASDSSSSSLTSSLTPEQLQHELDRLLAEGEFKNLRDAVDSPLRSLVKETVRSGTISSSKTNQYYSNIVFDLKHLERGTAQPMLDRVDAAIAYLSDGGLRWLDMTHKGSAKNENDVSQHNEASIIPLLVQLGNSLCPEDYVVAHFTQCHQKTGRIDHIISLHRLAKPLSAAELQKTDLTDLLEKPKVWSIFGTDTSTKSAQALMGIEDKYSLDQSMWSRLGEATIDVEIGASDEPEFKNYGLQVLKYVRLFRHRYVVLNDGNTYITIRVNRDDLEALTLISHDAVKDIPEMTVKADYMIYHSANARKGLVSTLFAALEDAFGTFDVNNSGGLRWERGGQIRGPVSFVKMHTTGD